ncbi:MAG TPA: 50S ribosomal protein L31 [Candidatus Wujingus californicus]|uniref:50S ribosomal protein L31 n=1 Tax=Candidatus Wujingus californicus TaxID=3367618 RepID=UPI001D28D5CD|nr:50S ribosomal protein L31 [Planctomycetota bacterium]MDO8131281.1 50S ribosomal protein L31 [Candidatus Brocadiales bacterium]
MKKEIHPEYVETVVNCGCGETFKTRSTKQKIAVEVCSKCHPFYTGTQKFLDSAGQIERFQKRLQKTQATGTTSKQK